MSATSTVATTARRTRRRCGRPSATRSRCTAGGSSSQGLADEQTSRSVDDEVRAAIEQGVAFALDAPFPDPSEVTEDVFA